MIPLVEKLVIPRGAAPARAAEPLPVAFGHPADEEADRQCD